MGNSIIFTGEDLLNLSRTAEGSTRKRSPHPLHPENFPGPQALINFIFPESYVQPHKHPMEEIWIPLYGEGSLLYFTESGDLEKVIGLSQIEAMFVEVPKDQYHGFVARRPMGFMNISQGPYNPNSKIPAPWAPNESAEEAQEYFKKLRELAGID